MPCHDVDDPALAVDGVRHFRSRHPAVQLPEQARRRFVHSRVSGVERAIGVAAGRPDEKLRRTTKRGNHTANRAQGDGIDAATLDLGDELP